MYRFATRLNSVRPARCTVRRYSDEAEAPEPLGITEENVLTVKRRARKPKAPKVQAEVAPPVQPSGHKLFTPLSATTSETVRLSLLHELGSSEPQFEELVQDVNKKILSVGNFGEEFDVVVLGGSELMGVEAVLSQTVPVGGKVLVITNGKSGNTLKNVAQFYAEVVELSFAEDEQVDIEKVKNVLQSTPGITNIAMVHCEASTGVVLPWKELVEVVNQIPSETRPTLFADVSNTFGAADLSWANDVDYLFVAPNRSLQGVAGFGSIIFKKSAITKAQSYPKRSLSLDFISQWQSQKETGKVPLTPATHALVALHRALVEHEEEGSWQAREQRYKETSQKLVNGMTELGFETVLPKSLQSHFSTYFKQPTHPQFNWEDFASDLRFHRCVVYSGEQPKTFGVSTVGNIFPADVTRFLSAVQLTKEEMKF
eukprot:TRINITY_DN15745_c0_g1_i1.p1 TRINITY_DN15745_c0_g1~~TRINITY_DN15745_c0_g1_i1.p1  ORF type:complete len:428 (-),score=115.78 TRINITY_DN15745_c0_g1_i1:23-1306(-)